VRAFFGFGIRSEGPGRGLYDKDDDFIGNGLVVSGVLLTTSHEVCESQQLSYVRQPFIGKSIGVSKIKGMEFDPPLTADQWVHIPNSEFVYLPRLNTGIKSLRLDQCSIFVENRPVSLISIIDDGQKINSFAGQDKSPILTASGDIGYKISTLSGSSGSCIMQDDKCIGLHFAGDGSDVNYGKLFTKEILDFLKVAGGGTVSSTH